MRAMLNRIKTGAEYRPFQKVNRLWFYGMSVALCLNMGFFLSLIMGPVIGMGCMVCIGLLLFLGFRRVGLEQIPLAYILISIAYAIPVAIWMGDRMSALSVVVGCDLSAYKSLMTVGLALLICFCIGEFMTVFGTHMEDVKTVAFSIITINAMVFYIIPISVMTANAREFSFNLVDLAIANLIPFLTASMAEIGICATCFGKRLSFLRMGLVGLMTGIYVQYMFLNYHLGQMAGGAYDWRGNVGRTIFNTMVWLLIFAALFLLERVVKNRLLLKVYFPLFLLGIQTVAVVSCILSAPKEAFEYGNCSFDGKEQFVVSSKNNVILFVLDAVDNSFINTIMEEDLYDFDAFQDFSMYTNTCSVFDNTTRSMPQMMTASTYDEYPVDYLTAYQRMKEAGYTINLYGYESYQMEDWFSYVDNLIKWKETDQIMVDYRKIIKNSTGLVMYLILPDLLKKQVPVEKLSFAGIANAFSLKDIAYANEDFRQNLLLTVNPQSENYFIMEHIFGAHEPNEGFEKATMECLDIVKEYINQLKKLGLYEQATILVTADHGLHDDSPVFEFPTVATPVFMIKMPNQQQEQMKLVETPVYHTDILPTILYAMDLYHEDGEKLFGKTIFDYQEHEQRERKYYNRFLDDDNKYYEYTYTGDAKDLEKVMKQGDYVIR